MAAITPAPGGGMVVKVNGSVLKAASWQRARRATVLPIPTSGMTANADGQYEVPNTTGLITTQIVIRGPYNTASPFHAAPYTIRNGVTVTAQFGQIAALLTPLINYKVADTSDEQDIERLGMWEATLVPATDDTAGYFTEAA